MLEVQDVTVVLGKSKVVDGASLGVERGAIVALVGPNGAGKTSLVRAISGIVKPSAGRITAVLGDRSLDLGTLAPHDIVKHGLSHVPEGRGLFTRLSVHDNLVSGSLFPRARSRRREQMRFVLDLFPRLEERSLQMSASLSGGEQQMLAVGRALMACPEVLILDEPSIGLAPLVVAELYRVLNELKQKTGITLLIIEQDIHYISKICDFAYVMAGGKIVQRLDSCDLTAKIVQQHYLGAAL